VSREIPPAIPIVEEPARPAGEAPPGEGAGLPPPGEAAEPGKAKAEAVPAVPPKAAKPSAEAARGPAPGAGPSKKARETPAPETAARPSVASAAHARPGEPDAPAWSRQKEELAYRVDFLGITMGYARFTFAGMVSIGGKTAYHVKIRAWTSGVLSYLYPINETIDYYLDRETIEPIRIEYTGRKKKRDDVAIYDQENGKIVYRYRDDGKVRKRVDVVPSIHDPVSAIYYFRWRDMGREDRPRNVYGGRKVYQIAACFAGSERLRTDRGEFDTLVVVPVIRRDGKLENKGDLKMWVTSDERRLPVRIYGKFRKIKEWTLVGELLQERTGG
jgi:hypothetical protein